MGERSRMARVLLGWLAVAFTVLPLLVACAGPKSSGPPFKLISGSENQPFESLVTTFAQKQGVNLQVTYRGSVDIMRELEKGDQSEFDAVWPAASVWIALGDTRHVVKHQASIMRSPVVFGVKKTVA